MHAAYEKALECSIETLTHPELLYILDEFETLCRRLPTQSHRILARLQREASPVQLGAKSLRDVLTSRLRISGTEARRRLDEAADLGPRQALSGEVMEPLLSEVAAARAEGVIGPEQVKVMRKFFAGLPHWVDVTTHEQAEATLVRIARGLGPEDLGLAAKRLAALIDQDGPEPDDAERARRRTFALGPQGPDGMSRISGWVDPQWRAT